MSPSNFRNVISCTVWPVEFWAVSFTSQLLSQSWINHLFVDSRERETLREECSHQWKAPLSDPPLNRPPVQLYSFELLLYHVKVMQSRCGRYLLRASYIRHLGETRVNTGTTPHI